MMQSKVRIGARPIILLVALLVMAAIGGVVFWRGQVIQKQSQNRRARAEKLIGQGKSIEALEVIGVEESVGGNKDKNDPDAARWRKLKQEAITKTANAAALEGLYARYPREIEADESASLLLFRAKAISRNKEDRGIAQRLVDTWNGKTQHREWWLAAKADILISQGKTREAERLLLARSFKGTADANRLLRLAMLNGRRDPQRAWDFVQQAYALTPRNPEVRGFRAQMLEAADQLPQARVEYAAAWLADPKNPMWCDQLAEFYRRHGDLTDAVQTWTDGLSSGADTDFIRTKALFWSRVSEPLAFPVIAKEDAKDKRGVLPPGPLQPFVQYLHDLPVESFWDPDRFDELMIARRLEKDRQEVFWLTVLHALQQGQERRALSLIAHNPFRRDSWNPVLEHALDLTLSYRLTGKLEATGNTPAQPDASAQHSFLGQLERYSREGQIPESIGSFLKSDNAFAGIVLASGWMEAALRLNHAADAASLPNWYVYGITQALRHNRGSREALAFARTCRNPDAPFDVLTAELLVAEKEENQALLVLARHAADNTDAGYRAAWLLATAYLDQNRPADAIRVIDGQPALARSANGIAMKARAALAKNNEAGASALYSSIRETSGEAKAYLARQAFDRGDFSQAERLTEELLKMYPDTLQLRANLRVIKERAQEARRKAGNG